MTALASRHLALFAAVLSALALSACSGDDGDDGGRLGPLVPLPECPDHDYSLCDTRAPACQERLSALASCVSGLDSDEPVAIEVLGENAYRALLEQELADVEVPPVNHFENALGLLRLVTAGAYSKPTRIEQSIERTAGFYRSSEKRIVLIDHDRPADDVFVNGTLLHELIHALQDAHYDLTAYDEQYAQTNDGFFASRSVIEGMATFYQYRVGAAQLGLDIEQLDFDRTLREHLDRLTALALDDPSPYARTASTVPYAFGALLMQDAWLRSGPAGADTLFANPPLSTQNLMTRVWAPGGEEAPGGITVPEPALPAPTADQTYSAFADVTLGAWGLYLFLQAANRTAEHPPLEPLALAWRADHLWIYEGPIPAHTVALWEIELATEEAARLVRDELDLPNPYDNTGLLGTRVYLAFGTVAPAFLTEAGNAWLNAP